MKIRTKLIIIFLIISIIPIAFVSFFSIEMAQKAQRNSIGMDFKHLAEEKANSMALIIKERIGEAENLSQTHDVIDAVKEANFAYAGKTDDEIEKSIKRIDREWIDLKGKTETAGTILNSDLSGLLKKYQSKDRTKYGEIFVTDIKGATVAMTKTLTDYYQADEGWWEGSFDNGNGKIFIDDRGLDKSIGALAMGVVVPVKDNGKVIGILKINFRVVSILKIVAAIHSGEKGWSSFLARSQGDILASTHEGLGENLSDIEKNALLSGDAGWSEDTRADGKYIVGYSPVRAEIFTRVPSPGEIKGISGEKWEPTTWFMYIELEEKKAFAPINRLKSAIWLIGFLIAAAVVSLALVFAKSISRPIWKLTEGASIIGSGDLSFKVGTAAKDEIGKLSRAFDLMTESLKTTTTSRDELIREVESRRQADEKLQEEKNKLEAVIGVMEFGLTIQNPDYEIIYQNKPLSDIFGRLGEKCYRVYEGRDEICEGCPVEMAFKDGRSHTSVRKVTMPSGEIAYWENTANPIRDAGDNIVSCLEIARNITERKKIEENLKESEESLTIAQEVSNLGSWDLNLETGELLWSDQTYRMFGIEPKGIVPSYEVFEKFVHPNDLDRLNKAVKHALDGKERYDIEARMVPKKGTEWIMHAQGDVIFDKNKKPIRFVGTQQDITEQKAMRQQLIQSEKLSSIGTFISGIAHELNNPLTVVLSFSQKLMDSENMPKEAMDDLNTISKQSKRTAKIVHELLKFSRTHKEGKVNVDINNALESILNFYSYTFKADNIELERALSYNLPKVFADSNQLQQVFTNIIMNAHHEIMKVDGRKEFTVKTKATDDLVYITFKNSGSPIPEEIMGKIFDPFFTSKEVGKGTGLGLYVSYGIIKDHGGDIKAENIGDSAVRFTISLPVADEEKKEVKTKTGPAISKGIRLLFVDDEELLREYISYAFSKHGISVRLAKDGKEAIDLINKTEFDVILADIKMPGMGGFELCEWLHENKPYYLERFVLATGVISVELEEYCLKYHCLSLTKPYSIEEILETIAELADKYNLGNKEV